MKDKGLLADFFILSFFYYVFIKYELFHQNSIKYIYFIDVQ